MTPEQAQAYLDANPDVAQAYQKDSYGLTPEAFAQLHYESYGKAEGRALPAAPAAAPAAPVAPVANSNPGRVAGTAAPTIEQQTAAPLQRQLTPNERMAEQRAADDALWASYQQQPWYHDFNRIPQGGGWSYDPRADRWTNTTNDLIDKYGTTDIYEYAQRQGLAVPQGWQANPAASMRDTSAAPTKAPGAFAGATQRRESIEAEKQAKTSGIGVRVAPGRRRLAASQQGLINSSAQGVGPTPGKPDLEPDSSEASPSLVSRVLRRLGWHR